MYQLPIIEKKMIAKDTMEVVLGTDGQSCDFKPGQYLSVVLPKLVFDDQKGNRRDFSIASSPNNKNSVSIAFRVSQSGFKQTLISLPLGTKVSVDCCYGVLTMPDSPSRPLVFIAGGIGVTPFMSAIRYAAEEKLPHKISLIYGNRDLESAAYLKELEALEKENKNFYMKKEFGPITKDFIQEVAEKLSSPLWYIVGSPHMVKGIKNILSDMGISGESIRFEEFPGYGKRAGDKDNLEPSVSHLLTDLWKSDDYESLLNTISKMALVAETDVDGNIIYVNDKFCEISKYSREELIGKNHRILKSGYHSPSVYEDLWKTISSGKVWRGEIKNKAKDGTFYWVDASVAPIFGKDGKIAKYIAVRFPITDRKSAEEGSKLLAGVVEQTAQAWGMADLSGKMIDANTSFLDLIGYSLPEIKSLKYSDFITQKDIERLVSGINEMAQGQKSFLIETECVKKDKTIVPVILTVSFYRENGAPKYLYAFLSDITERRKKEKEIAERLSEIERINQLMVGRELKMVELKEKLTQTEEEIKKLRMNMKKI